MPDLLLTDARPLHFRSRRALARLRAADPHGAPPALPDAEAVAPVDVRLRDGVVTEIGRGLPTRGADVLDAGGAYVIPGLWDAHAHLDLEAARAGRLDTTATRSAEEALALIAAALRDAPASKHLTIQGFGHRLSAWPRVPTVAELDAVTGGVPTVLISGDVHSGWINSAALRILGLPGADRTDPGEPMREDPWFALLDRLDEIPGSRELRESGYRRVLERAVAGGVTGVVDMSWAPDPGDWPQRLSALAAEAPLRTPRIRSAVYREGLEGRVEAGLRTGAALPGSPLGADGIALLTQGPLKIIADGSMGTASAHMRDPYPAALGLEHECGVTNIGREELTEVMVRARAVGFEAAIHAIGDAAVDDVVEAFVASGAHGRLEHAQLLPADAASPGGALTRAVAHGVELSIQPAHLIDDWAVVDRVWPGLQGRTYAFADMVRAGGLLHLGSDAPVAPLDPWLAMSAAVGRRTPDGAVWSHDQRLSAEEALAASVDGEGPINVGSRGDLVLLARNPLRLSAEELAAVRPLATVVAGRASA